jgi:hydroxyacylglutathione hydrolase
MKVQQLYTSCLSEAAYYIESDGEVAIIDPMRESAPYIQMIEAAGAKLKYVFETHFHADFVSGHLELASKTGAAIVYGAAAICDFECIHATDGQEFKVGSVILRAIHTPGHTPESTTYLLLDETGEAHCIFTGDTLFIGDVGRPDLAIASDVTVEQLAGQLYDSLHHKILPLPDHLVVYPAHGAGSACGKNISKETYDTLGHQRMTNYALQPMSKSEFVKILTDDLAPPPQYFPLNARLNQAGAPNLDEVYASGVKALSPYEFKNLADTTGAWILDTRPPSVFAKAYVPRSINIGLDGQFAPWVGALIRDINQPILLICPEGREQEAVMRLARVGYDHTIGYLSGGLPAWQDAEQPIETIESIPPTEYEHRHQTGIHAQLLDVRRPNEYSKEHLNIATNRPLDYINDWVGSLDPSQTYYIHCAGGYRSMVAASILASKGIKHVVDITGGYGAMGNIDMPRSSKIHTIPSD